MSDLTCGIDIGGTKIAGAVVDEDGTIVAHERVESPATDTDAIVTAITGLVGSLGAQHPVTRVGIGAAGYIDAGRAVVMFAPNIAWRDEDLRDVVEKRVELPVVVENDANAAAWGEFAFGAGKDVDDMLMVTVGTGVGGGLVLGGHLYRGGFGAAGEIGHLRVVPEGRLCGCGNLGCLEQYASGSALVKRTRELADRPEAAALLDRVGGDLTRVDGPLVTRAARDGDPFAVDRLAEVGRWLGEALASLAAVLDPSVTVVGGGVSEAGDLLLEPAREAFARELTGRGHRPAMEIRRATLGNDAGVVGAGDLARR
ncbi:MAG: glucokinase [Nocardioides sp.]|nr:glucokinase [Nocardioides sp.]